MLRACDWWSVAGSPASDDQPIGGDPSASAATVLTQLSEHQRGQALDRFADDSTGLDPHVCRPVVIAAANAEVHASDAPWACIAVVPLKLAGAVPDDPCGQVRGVEVRPHKWPAVGLFRSAVVRDGRLHCPSHKQASFRAACMRPNRHLRACTRHTMRMVLNVKQNFPSN